MKKISFVVSVILTMLLLLSTSYAQEKQGIESGKSKESAATVFEGTAYSSAGGGWQTPGGWYRFVPNEDGMYYLSYEVKSLGNGNDLYITMYSSTGDKLLDKRFSGGAKKVVYAQSMSAGKEYIFQLYYSNYGSKSQGPEGEYSFSLCGHRTHVDSENVEVIKLPTCEENGEQVAKCSACGEEVGTEKLPAYGHVMGEWKLETQATCFEPGWNVKRCAVCKKIVEQQELDKEQHVESEKVLVQKPSCTEVGYSTSICKVCGIEINRESVHPTGHVQGEFVETKAATCTSDGTLTQHCTVCMEVLQTKTNPAYGHSVGEWAITREAACLQSGLKEKKCITCGATLESQQLDALGHHYTEWEITAEATYQTEGEQRRHCVNCGDTQFEKIERKKVLNIF